MQAKEKILIIEDDRILSASMRDLLIGAGYLVDVADNPARAQPLLSTVDLALIDLKLPDKSGIQVLQELKQLNPEAEALIITGYAELHSAVEALNLGAFAYMEKPVNPDKLLLDVKRALQRRSLILQVKRREQEITGLTGFTGKILNDRVQLLEEAKGREERLSRLYHGIGLAFRAMNPAEAARKLLPLIAEETKANILSLVLIGTDKKAIERVDYFKGIEPFEIKSRSGGGRDEVLKSLIPIFIPELEKYSNPNPDMLARGIKSMAVYPLIVDNAICAVMYMAGLRPNAFAGMEQIIASFNDLCAIPLRQSIIHLETDRTLKMWEATANAMRIGIAITDVDRNIIQANKSLAAMVKVPLENIPGKKICMLIHGQPQPIPDCPIEKVYESNKAASIVIKENFLNIKNLEIRIAPVHNDQGEIIRFVHIFKDLDIFKYVQEPMYV